MNIIWLRNDLRITDNPALFYGAQQGECCCVYIITPQQWQEHDDAPAKIALWRQRLVHVTEELAQKNIPLKLLTVATYKDIPQALLALAKKIHAQALFFNKEYPLNEKKRDDEVHTLFVDNALEGHRFDGDVVMSPGTVTTQQGNTYKVFTPFSRQWHKCLTESHLSVFSAPNKQAKQPFNSDDIDILWPIDTNYRHELWPADSQTIQRKLRAFCANKVVDYKEQRDIPSIKGTSTISPYLSMGAIGVRQCIDTIRQHRPDWRENQWVTELIWREFYRHLIDSYPHLSRSENFIQTVNPIPWQDNDALFNAWCNGETGFPIVDAAMLQLKQTGWMHNRLRMITAAFLTKLLLIDWRKGEAFFMEHLLDGDYASNNGGWQWAASTGADAAPYFRIFNPERQSQRFDKEGVFIKKLLPHLSLLDKKSIHTPSSSQRKQCSYPEPIIDYKYARQRALDGYATAMGKVKKEP